MSDNDNESSSSSSSSEEEVSESSSSSSCSSSSSALSTPSAEPVQKPLAPERKLADSLFQLTSRALVCLKDGWLPPGSDDIEYYRAISPEFRQKMDQCSTKLLKLAQLFADDYTRHEVASRQKRWLVTADAADSGPSGKTVSSNAAADGSRTGKGSKIPRLDETPRDIDDADDVAREWELVTDVSDSLLERVDHYLDSFDVESRAPAIAVVSAAGGDGVGASVSVRPQSKFRTPADNSNRPWVPIIRSKPNAIVGLDASMNVPRISSTSAPIGHPSDNGEPSVSRPLSPSVKAHVERHQMTNPVAHVEMARMPHPYGPELAAFRVPPSQLLRRSVQSYESLADTPFTYVETAESLRQLARILDTKTEFAIDLEHHSMHSYHGFVCLMQISTREQDYIIDTLCLREELATLNTSFTNPAIVKVLHGASSDVVWLQRDFGIYLVNMFDTGIAARALGKPASLAHLLFHYCQVTAKKQYQLSDWRVRPLRPELVEYAREDTHYLLYIYDSIVNDLLDAGMSLDSENPSGLLHQCWLRSRDRCGIRYERTLLYPEAARDYLARLPPLRLSDEQVRVFEALYMWRDCVARELDESVPAVMSKRTLLGLVSTMPAEVTGVLAECPRPPSAIIRRRAPALVQLISRARKPVDPDAQPLWAGFPIQFQPIPVRQILLTSEVDSVGGSEVAEGGSGDDAPVPFPEPDADLSAAAAAVSSDSAVKNTGAGPSRVGTRTRTLFVPALPEHWPQWIPVTTDAQSRGPVNPSRPLRKKMRSQDGTAPMSLLRLDGAGHLAIVKGALFRESRKQADVQLPSLHPCPSSLSRSLILPAAPPDSEYDDSRRTAAAVAESLVGRKWPWTPPPVHIELGDVSAAAVDTSHASASTVVDAEPAAPVKLTSIVDSAPKPKSSSMLTPAPSVISLLPFEEDSVDNRSEAVVDEDGTLKMPKSLRERYHDVTSDRKKRRRSSKKTDSSSSKKVRRKTDKKKTSSSSQLSF